MRQFNPSLRTDQLGQYHTSVHGKRLAAGDTKVAVCTDCHSVHDLRAPSDPRSTVNPVNVANTCARCHSDAGYMKGYSIPTDQFAKYSTSVHHEALAVRGDLSAPTCTTCHGNHGAAPPGVDKRSECVFDLSRFPGPDVRKKFAQNGLSRRLLFQDASCVTAIMASAIQRTRSSVLVLTPSACSVIPRVTPVIKPEQACRVP